MRETLEANYKNLERVINWIENADKKANIIIAFNGGLIGLIFANSARISDLMENTTLFSSFHIVLLAVFGSFLIFFALSTYNALRVLLPDIKPRPFKNKHFYFYTIADFKFEKFKEKMDKLSKEQIISALSEQTYINAQIAKNKFDHLVRGWKLLAASIICGLLFITLLIWVGHIIN